MMTTFAGDPLSPCQALRRPAQIRKAYRSTNTACPEAWFILFVARLGCDKRLAWDTWQACVSSRWSTAKALAATMAVWQTSPTTLDQFGSRGIMPHTLVYLCECLLLEGLVSSAECTRWQEAILQHTTGQGAWKGHGYAPRSPL